MAVEILYSEDPDWVLAEAGVFLTSEPVLHNLILSLLHQRVEKPEPGRYWMAKEGDEVVGVVFQSPLDFFATVTPMEFEAVSSVVDAIVDAGVTLPGVSGTAGTAAQFAGQWTERTKSAAIPLQGLRIYEAADIQKPANVSGRFRQAGLEDRDLVVEWMRQFSDEVGQPGTDPASTVDRKLPAGQFWLWDDGGPVSMAGHSKTVEGVVRVSAVFTPQAKRTHGYAGACVAELSEQICDRGCRPILYTDLGNPVSNSIYRRIGYRAVAESLLYKFE
jgi:predicted GNAT family acetyltransferase